MLRQILGLVLVGAVLGACAGDQRDIRPFSQRGATADQQQQRARDRGAERRTPELPACQARPGMLSFQRDVDPATMVTVAAVGDVLLHDSLQRISARRPGGFAGLFAPVADILRAADVTFGNLEGPAAEGVLRTGRATRPPETLYDGRVYTGYPMFNYHPSVARDLRQAGFDVVLTANNHSLDRYALGADRTIEAVQAAGLAYTGTRHRDAMSRPWHAITPVTHNGRRYNIAWVGCTYGTNGIPDRHNQVLHCYEQRGELLSEIRGLAARDDIHAVMMTPHWGTEYQREPNAQEVILAREALEAGATAVIGGHPHVMQRWERHVTADGREGFILYSLGNFVSNQQGLPRRSSIILLLGLTPAENGKLAPAAAGWIPIRMHRAGNEAHAEAIDRSGRGQAERRHLLGVYPEANLHPAGTDFWAHAACHRAGQS